MQKSLFSHLWYRVESIRPRVRGHTEIHRHYYRDELWYVLQDKISGKYHRFTPAAYYLIDQMDGSRTLQEIWEEAVAHLGENVPTQDETIQLLGQLHAADVLATNVIPNADELFERHKKQNRQKLKQRMMSPLAVRIPLFDPEKILHRFQGWVSPLFGWTGFVFWLLVVGYGVTLAAQNWDALTSNVADTVLTPANLALIWLLFPLVKALHEFGHGFATKTWGGEVHEIGIMFLVFMPVPYVDASAASAFRERYKRVVVGAAGMLVEVFIASLALIVWVISEPGIVRSLAYNIILIAGVSTLLFNANPLLRFDGYYILTDLLEIPNLGNRSNRYIGYLIQKYVFGARQVESPASAKGEPGWFVFYGITSFLYRAFIMVVIAVFVATKFFFIGVMLAIWTIANMFLIPIIKHVIFVFTSPNIQRQRSRAISATLGTALAVFLVLFLVPAPLWTNAHAVVWLPENAIVRAGTSCFVEDLKVAPGSLVQRGETLIECRNEGIIAEHDVLMAKKRELDIRYVQELRTDRFKAGITGVELATINADLRRARERIEELTLRSPETGRFRVPLAQDLEGRFVNKGDVLGYIIQQGPVTARMAITQSDIELVRSRTKSVEVLVMDGGLHRLEARIQREVPGASEELPSPALGTMGGGTIPVDPRESGGSTAFEKIFQFDIALPLDYHPSNYGARVFVRINHGFEPIATQIYWGVREVFLNQFGV